MMRLLDIIDATPTARTEPEVAERKASAEQLDRLVAKLRTITTLDELDGFLHAPAFGYRPAWTEAELKVISSRRDWLTGNQPNRTQKPQQNMDHGRDEGAEQSTNAPRKHRYGGKHG